MSYIISMATIIGLQNLKIFALFLVVIHVKPKLLLSLIWPNIYPYNTYPPQKGLIKVNKKKFS